MAAPCTLTGLQARAINTIRVLSADMVEKANSGHPGAPMGCAPIAHVLFSKVMRYNPHSPKWVDRDRFVLSNGHACALLYSMLHLTGYPDMTLDDLKSFRQLHSKTAGHPENVLVPSIEVSTGPLGQGISNAVGIAIAQTHLAARYNKPGHELVSGHTYVLCGDGCLQEGVASEAASLAGHLGLGRLIVCYDDNHITIDGETELSFTEDVLARFAAYGWHTQHVKDGNNDLEGIEAAIREAQRVTDKPSIIKVTTVIGIGSKKEGKEEVHGAPLGKEDLKFVKTLYGFDPEKTFEVPEEALAYYREAVPRGAALEGAWSAAFARYSSEFPAEAAEFSRRFAGALPDGWMDKLPRWKASDKADATRNTSGLVLNAMAPMLPELVGGSADLTGSNKTALKGVPDFQKATPHGRYLRFGVREHAMAAICNGLASFGGFIPFGGTFLNFIGYAAGAVRLSALSHFRVIYVGTHDSIGLGEDGPTHQPVEMLESLRATPNMFVYRPADGNETSGVYAAALLNSHAPAVIALSRQNVPQLAGSSVEHTLKGGYIVFDTASDASAASAAAPGKPDLIVASTGTEVIIAIDGAKKLAAATGKRVQVASFPCLEIFERQPEEYRRSILQEGVPVLTVEASAVRGWERYGHAWIGMTSFGASGPYVEVYKAFGITADGVAAKGAKMLEYYSTHPVPTLPVNAPVF